MLEAAREEIGLAESESLRRDVLPHVQHRRSKRAAFAKSRARRAAEIINRSLTSSIEESLARELDAIVELGETESTRNLIRNFFLADKYKQRHVARRAGEKVDARRRHRRGRDGLGHRAMAQLARRLRDPARRQIELLDRGLANIEKTYGEAVKRGLMSEEKAKEGRSRIVASANPGPMREVQIVIEAASEKLEIKKEIFHDLDTKIDDTDILATNTSALSISDLAAADRIIRGASSACIFSIRSAG